MKSKKIFLVVIGILTLILGVVALLIGIQISNNQAPDDSSADASCTAQYGADACLNFGATSCQQVSGSNTGYRCTCLKLSNTCGVWRCTEYSPSACPVATTNRCPNGTTVTGSCGGTTVGGLICASNQRPVSVCNPADGKVTDGICNSDPSCSSSTTPTPTGTTGTCRIIWSSTLTGSFTVENCPGGVSAKKYTRTVAPGTTDAQCIPTTTNEKDFTLQNGTYDPRNMADGQCGVCVQIDVVKQGSLDGGSAQYTGDCAVAETVQCHQCTTGLTDANTCTAPQTFSGTSCPTGYVPTTQECRLAYSEGQCPQQTTCYQCTSATGDGDACEAVVVSGATCPAGTSTTTNGCAQAAGGSCTAVTTCYRCTSLTTDGNNCESFSYSGTSCPAGSSSTPTGCAQAVGGFCAATVGCNEVCDANRACTGAGQICFNGRCRLSTNTSSETCEGTTPTPTSTLPATAIFDDERANVILYGFMLIIIGLIEFKYRFVAQGVMGFVKGARDEFGRVRFTISEVRTEAEDKVESRRDAKLSKRIEKRMRRKSGE